MFLDGVTVEFDGFKALDVDEFGVYYNELRAIIGPNGAGKTTLCDVISGRTSLTAGPGSHEESRRPERRLAS